MNKKPKCIIVIILFFAPLISSVVMFGISEFPKIAPTKLEIKFMTYNIHFGQGMDDLLNLERIAQNILAEDPDIIGLQEVENGRITSQGVDMALWLAKRLNMMDYFYYPAVNEHAFGCALLSKFPIKNAIGTSIPSIQLERVIIHGVISINSTFDIDVFVTHLGLEDEDSSAQVDFILNIIHGESPTKPKVLMGDFNLNYSTDEIKKISNNTLINMTDTGAPYDLGDYTYPSYPSDAINEGVIDYIFATNCSIIDHKIIEDFIPGSDIAAEFGSDHRPVTSILRFI